MLFYCSIDPEAETENTIQMVLGCKTPSQLSPFRGAVMKLMAPQKSEQLFCVSWELEKKKKMETSKYLGFRVRAGGFLVRVRA